VSVVSGGMLMADHAAIALRRQAEVAVHNSPFDVFDCAGVVGANENLLRLGGADAGKLFSSESASHKPRP